LTIPLEFTGERFTPECVREIWYEHFHRYVFARERVDGLHVLDAACGEGYGSALLATVAASVTGVDVSPQAIEHARSRYAGDSLEYRLADCLDLPHDDDTFDCVVSFETLEHLEDHDGLMKEFRRVLKPNGFLLISSPDKAIYTDRLKNENEFHLRELYRDEFEALLGRYFPAFRIFGQKLVFQSAIWSMGETSGVKFHQECDGSVSTFPELHHDPVYLIAVCAADESCLPSHGPGLSLFDDAGESVYEHYNEEIRKHIAAGQLLAEQEKELAELRSRLNERSSGSGWWGRWFGKS
jgi:ubiquinone/menaquinone biosynthesis C-methylase UbiE